MKALILLLVLVLSSQAFAGTRFNKIVLKKSLADRREILKKKKLSKADLDSLEKSNKKLFKGTLKVAPLGTISSPSLSTGGSSKSMLRASEGFKLPDFKEDPIKGANPWEDTDPLFKEILGYLQPNYEDLGVAQIANLLSFNHDFDLGQENFNGFTWYKPMGTFSIGVNRDLAPDLFDDKRWIVTDTFHLVIDAKTLISNLVEEDMIEPMTDVQMGAFAGLSFKRTYTYVHFANSFAEGLKNDLDKLFFSFLKFKGHGIQTLKPYEYLTKQDSFVVSAGAVVYSPSFYGFSAKAGALFKFNHVSKVQIQSLGDGDSKDADERLRVVLEKSNKITAAAKAEVMLDFYGLLQLTLLSFDLEFEFEEKHDTYLTFNHADFEKLEDEENEDWKELKQVLRLRKIDFKALKDNVISQNYKKSIKSKAQYMALVFGGNVTSNSATYNIIKDNLVTSFLKTSISNLRYVEVLWSKLLGGVTKAILGMNLFGSKYYSYKRRNMSLEYRKVEEYIKSDKQEYVDLEDSLSILLTQEYYTAGTKGFLNKGYKNELLKMVEDYSNLSYQVYELVKNDTLIGPATISTSIRVSRSGLDYFNAMSEDEAFYYLTTICKTKRPEFWMEMKTRNRGLGRWQIGKAEVCMKKLGKYFRSYHTELAKSDKIPLADLEKFTKQLHKRIRRLDYILLFFGHDNAFFSGSFTASTGKNNPLFHTFFQGGQFEGLGMIHNYQYEQGQRVPASIKN
ncbi:MAG: hypothetical protein HOE90_22180 [Bacteriovoracaceae bacterium]|nr:hypothetical protein [Bacteriovoracaceae bacterium]